jgi:hypothetical protein
MIKQKNNPVITLIIKLLLNENQFNIPLMMNYFQKKELPEVLKLKVEKMYPLHALVCHF